MLGEKFIPDEHGKIVGTRIVASEMYGSLMEITFQSTGTIFGSGFNNTGTIVGYPRPGGTLHEEGQGLLMTADGEAHSWRYQGVFKPSGGLGGTHRGSVFFQAQPTSKLAKLNGLAAVVSAESDAEGNLSAELWEWA